MGRRLVAFGFVIFFLPCLAGTAIAGGGALDVVGRCRVGYKKPIVALVIVAFGGMPSLLLLCGCCSEIR